MAAAIDLLAQLKGARDALKITEVLSARGVIDYRAQKWGEFAITVNDEDAYSGAVWHAAERLFAQMEPAADDRALRQMPSRIRQFYLTCAMHSICGFEMALTGGINRAQLEQAVADYDSHRAQALAATESRCLALVEKS